MNFFDFQYGKKSGQATDSSVDIDKHNRRYHPHGFSDHTKCKYNQHGAGGSPGHYHHFASADEARKWLLENTGIESCHIKNLRDFFGVFGNEERLGLQFKLLGKPVSEDAFDFDCIVFAQTCKDIADRFGKIPFPDTVFVPYDFSGSPLNWLGASPPDKRNQNEPCYISIGNFGNLGRSAFGHSSIEFPYDVARHEIGHSLATQDVVDMYNLMGRMWDKNGGMNLKSYVSRNVSKRASEFYDEAIADIFSIRFSPEYSLGRLDSLIEGFADSMIKPITTKEGGRAMDERPMQSRSMESIPWIYRMCFSFLPDPPSDDRHWYDRETGKYMMFETHEAMARYGMSKLGIPVQLQEMLFEAYPDRAWDTNDVWNVKYFYYEKGMEYGDIVNSVDVVS